MCQKSPSRLNFTYKYFILANVNKRNGQIVVAIQGGHKVRNSFVENGIFLINAILL